ncbi:phosphopantetheine-binding protein [Streptomyces violascens]|uniref:phosphopantetheine-binding protein n=1 Tax=Streptomyces violascens TaxID=67381 RepID=UPI0036A68CCA
MNPGLHPHNPRSTSGEIDKNALSASPGNVPVARRHSPAQSEVATMADTLLGVDAPDLRENLFDLGGDSRPAVKAVSGLTARHPVALTVDDERQARDCPRLPRLSRRVFVR